MEENSSNMNLPEEQQSDLDHDKNMVWYQNISLDDAKAFIRNNIQSAARSFIAIGFYLKRIRDGKLYEADGYASVWELASDEYGISKSTASRYMTMNDRFSVDGNSPVIAEPYRDFEKSKLQEMLSLEYDQLEQVTPDMTVQQIRQLRPPKEIPYFELEGQMNLETDFPDVFPEVDDGQMLQAQMLGSQTETFSMKIDDLVGDDVGEPAEEDSDVAQERKDRYCEDVECEILQIRDKLGMWHQTNCPFLNPELMAGSSELNPCCRRCPHNDICLRACKYCVDTGEIKTSETGADKEVEEGVGSIATSQQNANPYIRDAFCNEFARYLIDVKHDWMLQDFEKRVFDVTESEAVLKEELRKGGGTSWYFPDPYYPEKAAHINPFDDYIQFWGGDGQYVLDCRWFYLCAAVQRMWNVVLLEKAEKETAAITQQNPEKDAGDAAEENHVVEVKKTIDSDDSDQKERPTDLDIARDILERQKRMLITARELPEGDIHRRREEVKTAAFASYVCELDNMFNPPPIPEKQEQPELPQLKNNEQRGAFIDAYATWPLWIHTKETGEKYYRYDLPNGNSIVVKTYRSMLFDYNSVYDLENRYHEGDGREEYYYLVEPKFFYDCKVNRSYLIDTLKELQKAGDKS